MSEPGNPAVPSTETPPPPHNGCLSGVMVLVGFVLLLPGVCALIFAGISLGQPSYASAYPCHGRPDHGWVRYHRDLGRNPPTAALRFSRVGALRRVKLRKADVFWLSKWPLSLFSSNS
jgi:hypothetical protein